MTEVPESWERERKAVQEALGEAALAWNFVEASIAELYSTALGAPTSENPYYRSIMATFYAIVSFDAKMKATNAALTYTLYGHKSEEANWAALQKRINRCKKTRNNLAHYTLVGTTAGKPGRQYWLQPQPLNPASLLAFIEEGQKPPIYYQKDLRRVVENFSSLRIDIDRLCAAVFRIEPAPRPPISWKTRFGEHDALP